MFNWILESDIFEENQDRLQQAIQHAGMTCRIIKYVPFGGGDFSGFGPKDFFYGSLDLAQRLRQESPECVIFNNTEAFECIEYYPVFGGLLLNGRCHTMIRYGDLRKESDWLFETFGSGKYGQIFLRPNSGSKTFTGLMTAPRTLEQDIEFIERFHEVPGDTLVVVSPACRISREYRFVVDGEKVITGSLYRTGGLLEHRLAEEADEPFQRAQRFLDQVEYRPDPLWTMDICQIEDGRWFVLEIGCFSCAGLYACDLDKVVKAVQNSVS